MSLVYKESLMHEPTLYLILDVLTFLSMSHLIYFVIDELKEILNVNLFIITRPLHPERKDKKNK